MCEKCILIGDFTPFYVDTIFTKSRIENIIDLQLLFDCLGFINVNKLVILKMNVSFSFNEQNNEVEISFPEWCKENGMDKIIKNYIQLNLSI